MSMLQSPQRRRDRINEKMKALQELIPRCNKVLASSLNSLQYIEHIVYFHLNIFKLIEHIVYRPLNIFKLIFC